MPTPANHTILVDSNGRPIPQYFVPGVGFKPLKGAGDNGPEYIIKSSALPTGAATEAKQDTLIGHVDGVESALASILAKLIAAPSTEAKQDALAALIGEVDADPTANTLLARLKSLEDKIDAITDGTSPAVTQLTGSIPEYNWFTTDGRPTPKEPTKPAIGVEVDADTMEITGLLWNGQEWEAR